MESFIGLLGVALMTGLVFARFSRPPAEQRAGAGDVERVMVAGAVNHPRLDERVGAGQFLLSLPFIPSDLKSMLCKAASSAELP